jgi:WD40 repeat protein
LKALKCGLLLFLALFTIVGLISRSGFGQTILDFHLGDVWLSPTASAKDTPWDLDITAVNAFLPVANESFYVKTLVSCVAGWTVQGTGLDCPAQTTHPLVTVNLDNKTVLKENCCDVTGITSLGPFTTNAGIHTLRVELNRDRQYKEPNYRDDVKVLTFTVPLYRGEISDLYSNSWRVPLWEYDTQSTATHCNIGILARFLGPQTTNLNYLVASASSDGSVVAAGTNDGQLIVLDGNGKILWTYDVAHRFPRGTPCLNSAIYSVSISANGLYIAVWSSGGGEAQQSVLLFRRNGTVLFEKDWINTWTVYRAHVALDDSGDVVIAAEDVYLYDSAGKLKWVSHPYPQKGLTSFMDALGQTVVPLDDPSSVEYWSEQLAVSPDGSHVAVVTRGYDVERLLGRYAVYVLDGRTGKPLWNYTEPTNDFHYFSSVAVWPDGKVLASNDAGRTYLFENGGSLRFLSTVLSAADIYGTQESSDTASYPTFPVAVRGSLFAVGVNYQFSGNWNATWNTNRGVQYAHETIPYGAYFYDTTDNLVGRIHAKNIITSIALTDSLIIIGSVGQVMAYSLSGLAQGKISRADSEINDAEQLGANVQAAQRALNLAKVSSFWFDAYSNATDSLRLSREAEDPIIAGLLENVNSTLATARSEGENATFLARASFEYDLAVMAVADGDTHTFLLHIKAAMALLDQAGQASAETWLPVPMIWIAFVIGAVATVAAASFAMLRRRKQELKKAQLVTSGGLSP